MADGAASEARKLRLEIEKLAVEIPKLRRERFFDPSVVGSGLMIALAAIARLFGRG